jgi:hypothetical protein
MSTSMDLSELSGRKVRQLHYQGALGALAQSQKARGEENAQISQSPLWLRRIVIQDLLSFKHKMVGQGVEAVEGVEGLAPCQLLAKRLASELQIWEQYIGKEKKESLNTAFRQGEQSQNEHDTLPSKLSSSRKAGTTAGSSPTITLTSLLESSKNATIPMSFYATSFDARDLPMSLGGSTDGDVYRRRPFPFEDSAC